VNLIWIHSPFELSSMVTEQAFDIMIIIIISRIWVICGPVLASVVVKYSYVSFWL